MYPFNALLMLPNSARLDFGSSTAEYAVDVDEEDEDEEDEEDEEEEEEEELGTFVPFCFFLALCLFDLLVFFTVVVVATVARFRLGWARVFAALLLLLLLLLC
jgi:uncharacterized protein YqhQ